MVLWYRAYECEGKVDEVLDDVEYLIAKCKLRTYIPEVFAGTFLGFTGRGQKRREQFRLYVGINSAATRSVPDQVARTLFQTRHFRRDHKDLSNITEVEAVKEEWQKRTTGRVFYRSINLAEVPTFHDERSDNTDLHFEIITNNLLTEDVVYYDRLLKFLSAIGEGSWAQFCRIYSELWSSLRGERPERVLRRLRLLSHVSINADRTRWRISPPTLLALTPFVEELEGNCTRYVLCGARDETLLHALSKVGSLTRHVQSGEVGTSTIYLLADPMQLKNHLLNDSEFEDVLLQEDPRAPIDSLPTLSEWQANLSAHNDLPTYEYDLRLFNGEIFKQVHFDKQVGVYEIWERVLNSSDRPKRLRTLFYGEDGLWRDGDWYGLRFLHQARFDNCPYAWDADTQRLMLPERWRLPHLYEQALTLISGKLPARHYDDNGDAWLFFSNVTHELVRLLDQKLPLLQRSE